MKIEVDHNKCIGCGMCKYIDDKTFEFDDDGYIVATTNEVTDLTKEAQDNCPVSAIKIYQTNKNDEI